MITFILYIYNYFINIDCFTNILEAHLLVVICLKFLETSLYKKTG
jgi:hypothetical protein